MYYLALCPSCLQHWLPSVGPCCPRLPRENSPNILGGMVGGLWARSKPISCCLTSASSLSRPCFPRIARRSAAVSWNNSRSKPGQLRVAQQFGDTLTDVSTNTAQQQQVPLQDAEEQLRAAVEEAVPVVGVHRLAEAGLMGMCGPHCILHHILHSKAVSIQVMLWHRPKHRHSKPAFRAPGCGNRRLPVPVPHQPRLPLLPAAAAPAGGAPRCADRV